ncbi:transporter substrate-binding domain-containing protein [Thalassomonas sp. RHCl1]|uniref:transporter substrate-binding domain-containing protein n=1 Tax=Thalassomonas sp. RHCl1 TaxID=2995320 RepID=UPI00248B1BC9|nr:transporter substrate-binding domain-containing protein [Thalassomonas sp. RHCl1]
MIKTAVVLFVLSLNAYGFADPLAQVSLILPFSKNNPPHYFASDEGELKGGIEPDILWNIFSGMKVEMVYYQLNRATVLFKSQQDYDCISPAPAQLRGKPGFYESKEIFSSYYNRAIVLASAQMPVTSLMSLQGKEIRAFPGASEYLGEEFAELVKKNKQHYRELSHLIFTIPMLFYKRFDVLIMDEQVFRYHASQLKYDFLQGENKVVFHHLLPVTHYTLMCKNKALIEMFDSRMKKLRESGELDAIIRSNINKQTH